MAWTQPHGDKHRGVFRDPDGKTVRTAVQTSKRAALKLAQDAEAKVRGGTYFDPGNGKVTFSDYFEHQWFPNRGGEQGTRDTYESHYRAAVKPKFGDMELRRIIPSTVQGWVTEMHQAGVKPSTIKARITFLQTVLAARKGSSARRDGLIATNPCENVLLPTVVDPEVVIFEPEEFDDLIAHVDPWWSDLATLATDSGARWGELMGLCVEDFSLDYRRVTIRRTVIETAVRNTGNGTRFKWKDYPKGKQLRVLGLLPEASEAIKLLVAERGLGVGDRLFSMPTMPDGAPAGGRYGEQDSSLWVPERTDVWPGGVPISRAFFRQSVWVPALKAAGVEYRKFHATRGSHLSWLIAAGADMNVVMDRAGHKEWDTTRKYMKPLSDADDAAMEALGTLRSTRRARRAPATGRAVGGGETTGPYSRA